jgi:hypothetical protein
MTKNLHLRATAHSRQYVVEGRTGEGSFDEHYVNFSGYFGNANPCVFASAIELYEAAKGIAAVGIINPTGSEKVEQASQALFAAIRLAERDIPQPVEAQEAAE